MVVTIRVFTRKIGVQFGLGVTLWFDDWSVVLRSNIIRDNDTVHVQCYGLD
jgi:hypothetical protein